ncbi:MULTISPECIES: glycogen synthase GlgA [unclassified Agarivorans]|uniref:glycogen synthase GlgA n=1 Tax=unclassified Agarivorans TaxID=2636026 RepID=UPI003D7E5E63
MTAHPVRILFLASEVESLAKTGGLADVAKALPLALKEHGQDVRIIMPFYKTLKRHDEAEKLLDLRLHTANHIDDIEYSVYRLMLEDVPVYLIKQPAYFDRDQLYSEGEFAYDDNGERFSFFSRAVFQVAKALDFKPDIFHCNDWHTALVPYLLKQKYAHHPFFCNSKSVLTIHNAAFQGIFEKHQFHLLEGLADGLVDQILDGYNCINLLKAGIRFADKINAVSANYAQELLTRLGSHGLCDYFEQRRADLVGILNGCDYSDWDPKTDQLIPSNYSQSDLSGKAVCRQALQLNADLPQTNAPIFGMVCRLTEQKGFYLLLPALEQFLRHNVQVIIVGTGDSGIVAKLQTLEQQWPNKLRFIHAFSNELAHLVEAGADFFLMPSLFEPCGLNQMYSLAYGTLPIVRGVGGLKDTVTDFDEDPLKATGHIFYDPEPADLLNTLRRALLLYLEDYEAFKAMRHRAMESLFHWQQSVWQYEALYNEALNVEPVQHQ